LIRARRAVEFVEFLEQQQPTIAAGASTFLGFQRRAQTRRAVGGCACRGGTGRRRLAVRRAGLSGRHQRHAAGWIPYSGVHYGLLVLLVVIVVALVAHMRNMNRAD
jgi:hypothetical protein